MVYNGQQKTSTNIPTKKILLWLAMVSMIMIFAGLTSAYIVRQAEGNWLKFDLPKLFSVSTAIILFSSVSMNWALSSAKRGNIQAVKKGLGITLFLGLAFVVFQFLAWQELYSQHIIFGGKFANPAGSFLYVLTGLHIAHLLGGLIYLIVVLLTAIKQTKTFGIKNLLSIQLCATYWHFLDGLWIYLFLFLLFIR